jgi:hypothetical protein
MFPHNMHCHCCAAKRLKNATVGQAFSFACRTAMEEQAPDNAFAGLAANAAAAGGLDDKLTKVEAKLEKLETAISTDDEAAAKTLGYGDLIQAKAALPRLEERLNLLQSEKVELLKKENFLLEKQHSGAGMLMSLWFESC